MHVISTGSCSPTCSAVPLQQQIVATPELCVHCFDVLVSAPQAADAGYLPNVSCPLFVTWEKNGQLRGCIGSLSPKSLPTALAEYATLSAKHDRRFTPIQPAEWNQLSVGVSLLVQYETCSNWNDWEIGVHGIVINFRVDTRSYSGTFLPEVAPQQGWNKQQTLVHLMQKAGYRETLKDWSILQVTRYQSSKCKLTAAEYAERRQLSSLDPSSTNCRLM